MMLAMLLGGIFGFTGYHIFVAPYVLKSGLRMGMLMAANDLKAWLDSVEPNFKDDVHKSMSQYNMNRKLEQLLKQVEADGVAREGSKK